MRTLSALGVALGAILLSGCGPTEREAGQAVLMVAPLLTLAGTLVAAAYARMWRPLVKGLRFDARPSLYVAGVQGVLALYIAIFAGGEADWLLTALCFVGSSYLAFQCVCLRLGIVAGLRRHYTWLSLLPWLLLYGQALGFGFFGSTSTEADGIGVILWCFPGYLGLVTGPLMLLLAAEVFVRRRRQAARVRAESLPRPLPVARIL